MAQVLPVGFSVVVPDGLVEIVRGTVHGNAASGRAHPVERVVVVRVVAGNVVTRCGHSVRVADDAVAPVHEDGTHNIIGGEILVVGVDNHHDGLLVGRIGDVGRAVQIPHHVARHFPSLFLTRRLPGTERIRHQLQSVIADKIGGHGLGLGILAHDQITLDEQLHASLLVHLAHILHLALRRNMLHSKLQIAHKHLEHSLLARRSIVALGHLEQFRHQRYVAKLQTEIVVGIGPVEVGASHVGIARGIVKPLHLAGIRQDGVGILHHIVALIPEPLHVVAVTTASHTRRGCEFGVEIVLKSAAHVGLSIHAHVGHEVVGEDAHIVPVAVDAVGLQLFVTLRQRRLQARLCGISLTGLVERQGLLLQKTVRAGRHGACHGQQQGPACYVVDAIFHVDVF